MGHAPTELSTVSEGLLPVYIFEKPNRPNYRVRGRVIRHVEGRVIRHAMGGDSARQGGGDSAWTT